MMLGAGLTATLPLAVACGMWHWRDTTSNLSLESLSEDRERDSLSLSLSLSLSTHSSAQGKTVILRSVEPWGTSFTCLGCRTAPLRPAALRRQYGTRGMPLDHPRGLHAQGREGYMATWDADMG
jgi:hypothetical protein